MNTKQWVWIYGKIRELFDASKGQKPNEQITGALFTLYEYIGEVTEKNREINREMDDQLRNIFNYLFDLFHSLEVEGKEV